MNKPFYRIEYLCTYFDAVWLYKCGGINGWIDSDNLWDFNEENVYENEEEARKVWNEQFTKTYIWDPADFGADENFPEVGISEYSLSRYDENMNEQVLELSSIVLTPEDIQKMYPNFDFENAED